MGKKFSVKVITWQQAQATTSANYVSNVLQPYDGFNRDIRAITGENRDPMFLIQQISYSVDGTVNNSNTNS